MNGIEALGKRETILVMTLPGDRRDEDIITTVQATHGFVQTYLLHDSHDRRGRQPNAVPELMRSQLPSDAKCEILPNQDEAIQRAWQYAQPGDRVVVIADLVDNTIEKLMSLAKSGEEDAACDAPMTRPVGQP
jgi:cyanophycin synthetase